MIEHVWSILCRRSIIDKDTNSVSIVDVMEAINVETAGEQTPTLAGIPLDFEIVTLWVRADSKVPARSRYRIRMQPPSGPAKPIGEPTEVDLRTFERLRARTHVSGIPLSGPGRYRFIVELEDDGWTPVSQVPLDIEFPGSAQA